MGNDNRSVAGRRVVITGGSKGIGREIALALVHAGADVIVTGRNEHDLNTTEMDAAGAGGGKLKGVRADVRDPKDCERVIDAAAGAFGGVDALINNAGVALAGINKEFQDSPPKFWDVAFDPWRAIVAALPKISAVDALTLSFGIAPFLMPKQLRNRFCPTQKRLTYFESERAQCAAISL